MTGRGAVLSILTGLAVLAAAVYGVLAARGGEPGAVEGVLVGTVLGVGGSFAEALLVHRALRGTRDTALRVVLGSFGVRLVLLLLVTVILERTGLGDGAAFALTFLGGFLAALPVFAAAVASGSPLPGTAGGPEAGGGR